APRRRSPNGQYRWQHPDGGFACLGSVICNLAVRAGYIVGSRCTFACSRVPPTLFYLAREPGDVRGDETADVARPVEIVHFLHRLDEIADDSRLDRALVVEDFELAIIVVGRADVGGTQARSLDQDVDRLAAMGIVIEPVHALRHGGEETEEQRLVLLGPGDVGRVAGER